MTDLRSDVDAPSDAELISRVRGGDVAAYGELFSRHQAAANRLARQLVRGPDADDLVSEAFAKVLTVLQGGGGPDVAFRAYLLTAVRRLHVDRVRVNQRLQTTDDMTPFDPGVPFQDTAVAGFESGAAAKAFASLPERWQLVLWHLEVEGQKPADIAPLLGMSANSVSALAYRAREGLRQAFLTMHLSDISETDCRWVNEHLGAFVRKGLSKRDAGKVQGHLDECRRCTAMYLELTDVNSNLAGIIAPLLLGAAATGYLASGGAGIAGGGIAGLVSRVKDFVGANTGAVAAAGVAAGVAAVAATAVLTLGGNDEPSTTADPATGSSTGVPSSVAPTTPAPSPTPSKSAASRKSPSASASPSTTPSTATSPATASSSASASVSPSATLPAAITALTELPTDATTSPSATTSPGDGSTGTPPPPPAGGGAPTITSLSIDPDGGSMDLVLDGLSDPSTPVDIALMSSQTTFGTSMAPGCSRGDPRHVRCLPGTTAAAGRAAAVGAVSAADPRHYEVTLPLEFPDDMDSDELVIVVSIDGSTQSSSQAYTFRPSPRERLALGALHVLDHDPLIVRAPISGVRSGTARLTLDGDAAFGGPVTSGCSRDSETSVTCAGVPAGSSDLDVAVRLTSDRAYTVTLRVNAVRPFFDPDSSDNSRPLPPAAVFAMTGLSPDPASSSDGSYAVTSTVTVPKGLGRLAFATGDGATFARTAGCTPNDDNTRISCERGTGASYDQAFVLVATNAEVDTDAAVSVVVPDDYLDLDPRDNTATGTLAAVPVVKHADVALTLPASVPAQDDGTYRVTGTLTGVPSDYTGQVTYGASNGASFDPDAPSGCALESDTLVCDPVDHPAFHLVADDNRAPTDATITVAPLPGYVEDGPGDNAANTTLETFVPDADLSLTVPGEVAPSDDGEYHFDGRLAGVPSDYTDKARYSVSDGAAFVAGDGCTVSEGGLVCEAGNGSVPFHLKATNNRSSTPVTIRVAPLAGHTDKTPANNSADTTLQAFTPDADLSLTLPADVGASDDGEYRFDGTLHGVPTDYTGKAHYSVSHGAAFVAGNGCTVDSADLVCDADNGSIPFHLTATDHRADTPVTITVAPLAGHTDKNAANNADDTTLRTFVPDADVSLTLPSSAPASDDGSYAFHGTLAGVPDGFDGTARFSLTGTAAFIAGNGCTLSAATLVCDAANGSVPFHLKATDNRSSTPVTIRVAPLAGYTDPSTGNNSDSTTLQRFVPDADVSLTLPSSAPASDDGEYRFDGRLAGVPDGFGEKARFSLTGAAAFVAGNGCTLSEGDLVCDAANGSVSFHLKATDNRSSTPVTIRVAPLAGYTDPSTGNNSDSTTLQRFVPDADVSLTLPSSAPASDDGEYRFDGRLAGVPDGFGEKARFSLTGAAAFVAGNGCTLSAATLVCDAANGSVPFHLKATDNRSSTPVTIRVAPLAGYDDPSTGNNSDSTTLQRFVPDADLSLTVPGSVDPSDDGSYSFDGTMHGVPSDYTGQARFSVSRGAVFVAGNGCIVSNGDLVCEAANGSVPFHLKATNNRSSTPVTIRVAPLAGHTDKTPGNNSDTTTLRRFVPDADVSLTLPAGVGASDDGEYRFDATLHGVPSDYTGQARYSISDGAVFAVGNGCTLSEGDLVCDAANGSVPFHLKATDNRSSTPVTIRVAPLSGYTDPSTGNNSDSTTLQRFTPDADLSLTVPGSVDPSDDGSYSFDGTMHGVPSDYTGQARFSVSRGAVFVAGNGCIVSNGDLVCDADNGSVPFHLTAIDNRADTPVTITVAPLAGHTDKTPANNNDSTSLRRFVPDADVSLTLPSSAPASDDGEYHFDGTLAGVPDGFDGTARFSLTGAAAFIAGNGCTLSEGDLVCDAANGTLPFHLKATNNRSSTPVTIRVAPLAGHTDKTPANNSDSTTLQRFVPDADVSLTLPAGVGASDDGEYHFDGTLAGVPDGFDGTARFSLTGTAAFVAGNGCTLSAATLVCDAANGSVPFHLKATDNRSSTPVTIRVAPLAGYDDPSTGNNSDSTTLQRFVPDADLSLTLPADVGASDDGSYSVDGTLAGVPTDYTGKAHYSVSDGAAFVAGNGCTVDSADLVCDADNGTVPFHLTATDNRTDTPVTITVAPLAGHTDKTPANNSADTTLQRFTPDADLSLTVPAGVGASDDGEYRFDATLHGVPSDYTGQARFSVSDGAVFVAGNGCTLSEGDLVCDAANGTVPFHLKATNNRSSTPVTIRVAPLAGYTDPSTGNNSDSTILQRFTPDADLSLTLPADVGASDDGSYAFHGTLDGVPTDYTGKAHYSVSDGAAFVAGNGCTLSNGDLVCDADNGTVPFHLTATDNRAETPVTITVGPLTGHTDKTPGNNSDTTTLRTFVPDADLSLTVPGEVAPSDDGEYRFDGRLAGVPDGFDGAARFSLTGAAAFVAGNGCTLSDAALVCDAANGSVSFHLKATNNRSSTPVTIRVAPLAGHTDKTPANNSDSTTLQRFVPDADLSLTVPDSVGASDDGSYAFHGTLDGVPSDYTGKARYSVSDGAAFVAGNGCTLSDGDLVCDADNGTVPFHLTATNNRTDTPVTITVAPLTGHTDKTPANNSDTTTLQAYVPPVDVSLDSLERISVHGSTNVVRAGVSGVPAGVNTFYVDLIGDSVGTAGNQVHFIHGADGASGAGTVTCAVTTPTRVTCHLLKPSFTIDMDVQHPQGRPDLDVTMTVTAVNSGEPASNLANNSRAVAIR